jgi:hypothetical protein
VRSPNTARPATAGRDVVPPSAPGPVAPVASAIVTVGAAPAEAAPVASSTSTTTGGPAGSNGVPRIGSPIRVAAGAVAKRSEHAPVTAVASAVPSARSVRPAESAVQSPPVAAQPPSAVNVAAVEAPGASPRSCSSTAPPGTEIPAGGVSRTAFSVSVVLRFVTVAVSVARPPAGTLAGASATLKPSQTSPCPSASESACPEFARVGQLSAASPMPSPSASSKVTCSSTSR